ncbi:hypothetical protein ABIE44_002285 [Marmoricola sp. OAE513]|uniref:hypothetical protein n=1 Tax=Marmoricola sp. OAE513 TaxID=2817894 RepID=UPI001AE93562
MPAPLPYPVRVLVKGSSLVVMTPERDGAPGEYTFPRWIQNGLLDRGRPCEIDNRGVAGEPTRKAFNTWEAQVMAGCPDVVVYGYAYYECIHSLLPHWLERYVNTYNGRTGPVRTRFRGYLVRPLWKVLAQMQRVVDGHLADRVFRWRAQRIAKNYSLLIRRTRSRAAGSPLVFVLSLLGPGGRAGGWFPGMQSRIDTMNKALVEMLETLDDPGVVLVPVGELAAALNPPEDPVPDGMHYTPRMRRSIGNWIAAEIDRRFDPIPPDRAS